MADKSEKSHKCYTCGKVFSSASNMWRHKKTSHENVRSVCPLCTTTFTRKESLRAHLLAVHRLGGPEVEPAVEPVAGVAVEPAVEPAVEVVAGVVVEPAVELAVAPVPDLVAVEPVVESIYPLVQAVVSAPLELELHPTGSISDDEEEPVRPRLLMRLPKSAGKGIRMSTPPPSPTTSVSSASSVSSAHSLVSERSSSGVSSDQAAKRTREEDIPEGKPRKIYERYYSKVEGGGLKSRRLYF